TRLGARAVVSLEVHPTLAIRLSRSLFRVDADSDDIEVLADREIQRLETLGNLPEHHRTHQGAVRVTHDQDDRPPTEVVGELNIPTLLVAEGRDQRNLGVEVLVERDLLEGATGLGRGPGRGGDDGRNGDQEEQTQPRRKARPTARP